MATVPSTGRPHTSQNVNFLTGNDTPDAPRADSHANLASSDLGKNIKSALAHALEEKGLSRYSKSIVKTIAISKERHPQGDCNYWVIHLEDEDNAQLKSVFARLQVNCRSPEVDSLYQEGSNCKEVSVSMPGHVQRRLRRPFNQAISSEGKGLDGGDHVFL